MNIAYKEIDYAPGMRVIIRDEEWMVKKVETNALADIDCRFRWAWQNA